MIAWTEMEQEIMERAADIQWRKAVAEGLVVQCPTCHILHGGLRFEHTDHQAYCSTNCFRERIER